MQEFELHSRNLRGSRNAEQLTIARATLHVAHEMAMPELVWHVVLFSDIRTAGQYVISMKEPANEN